LSGQWPSVLDPTGAVVRDNYGPVKSVPVPACDVPLTPSPTRTTTGKWNVVPIGDKWAVIQPWAEPVYWLRYFDSFDEAKIFVKNVVDRMSILR
jgi:hypothetical protein